LRLLVPAGKTVREVVSEDQIQKLFQRLQK